MTPIRIPPIPAARPLFEALAAYEAAPSRDAWRLVVVLASQLSSAEQAGGPDGGYALSDEEMCHLAEDMERASAELGHADLFGLLWVSWEEAEAELPEWIRDLGRSRRREGPRKK